MGSLFSKLTGSSEPIAPEVIEQENLLKQDSKSIDQLRDNYRNLGFAVIECTDEFKELCTKYRALCEEWFHQHTFAEKQKFLAPKMDDLLGRPNIGYLLTPHKKEYLRFKDSTKKEQFPNQDIYNEFSKLIEQWHATAEISMKSILSEKVLYGENMHPRKQLKSNQIKRKNEKEWKAEASLQTMCDEVDEISKFGKIHSSISIVHYFKNEKDEKSYQESMSYVEKKEEKNEKDYENDKKENKNENEKEMEKEKETETKKESENEKDWEIANRTESIALDKHNDTGLMTFIICSDVNGLEMLDRQTNKYFHCEPYYFDKNKCHMFIIAGRKMEIFSYKKEIKATWHRVTIPTDKERMTLLYFMEITKEH